MSVDQESRSTTIASMQNGLAALCAVGTVLLIWWLLKYSAYGVDLHPKLIHLA